MSALERAVAMQLESQRKMIADLQAQLLPGWKLMTCPQCKKISKYSECQQVVSHIETNYGGVRRISHPGEIDPPGSAFGQRFRWG